jgi:hypothetical protein
LPHLGICWGRRSSGRAPCRSPLSGKSINRIQTQTTPVPPTHPAQKPRTTPFHACHESHPTTATNANQCVRTFPTPRVRQSDHVDGYNNQEISPLQDVRNYDMELLPDFSVRCALDCGYPLSFAEGGAFRLGVAQPWAAPRPRGAGAQGGERPRPSEFCAVAGRERACLWAYQEGQMGQKMVCFGQLRPTRSRQDESIEVSIGEVGSKRPSLGCNGVHVVRCSGLIFWLLHRHSNWSHSQSFSKPCVLIGAIDISWTNKAGRQSITPAPSNRSSAQYEAR